MRILIAAVFACTSAAAALGQSGTGVKSTPAPHATLPQTWQDAQRSFAVFGAQTDVRASTNGRTFVVPPQIVARNVGAEPIPGQWPNLKFEPIPTTWPKLKLLLAEKNSAQALPTAKK
ncbi:MAG: hypothetical protein P4L40_21075 [Terracidiphilus sp.]|nr:hypothetical protein [Terracidiphilus sp.]